jgi:hypothetical protein
LRSLSVLIGCVLFARAGSPALAGPAIDPAAAEASFREARATAARDGGALWGVNLEGPILLVDPTTRAVVASQADRGGVLRARGRVFVGTLPREINIARTAVAWSGVRWTMLSWPLPEERQARIRLVMHEAFHRIQNRIGLRAVDPANRHLDSRQGRMWLRLEWRALERALQESGAARRQAIRDALSFRRERHRRFPAAAREEAALELHEGLAEYTGYAMSARSPAELAALVAYRLREEGRGDSFARSFAYASGPAYGTLLNAMRPGWRSALRPGDDLADLLRRAVGGELRAGQARARAPVYDGDEVIASERRRERARAHQRAEHRARFVTAPVLVLPLSEPDWAFDPNTVLPLDAERTFYPELRMVDTWGILEASRGALLVRKRGKLVEARVPAPSSIRAPLRGDSWSLDLAPGWRLVPGRRRGDFEVRPASSQERETR